jgi:alpha-glucosidase (family GH31 glycosyl hydrolase)
MFGNKYLVAPVMDDKADGRKVYLPKGAQSGCLQSRQVTENW